MVSPPPLILFHILHICSVGKLDNYTSGGSPNIPHGCPTGMGENDGEDKTGD